MSSVCSFFILHIEKAGLKTKLLQFTWLVVTEIHSLKTFTLEKIMNFLVSVFMC